MLSYIPGATLADVKPRPPGLNRLLGEFLSQLDAALLTFSHPATRRELKWDSVRSLWVREQLHHVGDPEDRALAAFFLDRFEHEVLPILPRLRRSVIYGDANDYNVLVRRENHDLPAGLSVIDFGDMHESITVAEPAIAAAYALLGQDDPVQVAHSLLAGFEQHFPLNAWERAAYFPLIATRLAVSVVNSACRKTLVPDDPYVTVTEAPAWDALRALRASFSAHPSTTPLTYDRALAERKRLIGPSVRLSYDKPLNMVRGSRQYLYDAAGQAYLDVYNNVPLVGHSHPRVAQAAAEQLAVLNTNTRYLHDTILRYAARLTELLPAPLKVCYLLNSGSEANELAIRLARAHTQRDDIIVLEHAYHGHTSTLTDISPYKFDGPGGKGRKPWVAVAAIPDDYRGKYRRGEANLGERYAADVTEILENIAKSGRGVAAFIAETLPSVAGQILFPPRYLAETYRHVRAAGGVCIADEVQVGFGRLGTHFWGFETQDVIPDIAVFGKPIGNGFPLAAVVTTAEIARSFDNGMEFFSTFGGNPVACAAGLAVLDVLAEERLQQNALHVGANWLAALRQLQDQFRLIGDVRGSGLFLGVELVRDRQTRAPAPRQASHTVNRLREEFILAGTDGPHHNVIKLRPPLIFSDSDADQFTTTFARILAEDGAQPD